MSDRIFCFAPLDLLDRFLAQGWTIEPSEKPTHHEAYSRIVEWRGPGDPPPIPKREDTRPAFTGPPALLECADEGDVE